MRADSPMISPDSRPGQNAAIEPGPGTSPFGFDGIERACKCGADRHTKHADRCAGGHPLKGAAGPALVVGNRGAAFWRQHEEARQEIRKAIIADQGLSETDAPRALQLAAESIAQAVLVRDSAYTRLVEAGGPLSSSGRTRRCFTVWAMSVDRVERHLKLVGLKKTPKGVATSFAEALRAAPKVGGER